MYIGGADKELANNGVLCLLKAAHKYEVKVLVELCAHALDLRLNMDSSAYTAHALDLRLNVDSSAYTAHCNKASILC